ncbi:MAG: fatty acid desaturase [Bermanella sp.]
MNSLTQYHGATDNEALFKQLTKRPQIAWPTVALFIFLSVGLFTSTYCVLQDIIPFWAALCLNSLFIYQAFTVVHDATHNSLSLNKTLNQTLGQVATFMLSPVLSFKTMRYVHMQHHRFANDPIKDPDHWLSTGSLWTLPFRLSVLDLRYTFYYLRNGLWKTRPKSEIQSQLIAQITGILTFVAIYQAGFLMDAILLWILPSRIAILFLALAFAFLPHYPHDASAQENQYKASNNRVGFEWLLTPLLLGQNYHLVHHLYPTVPFYRYLRVWKAKEKTHLENDPLTMKAFSITPS